MHDVVPDTWWQRNWKWFAPTVAVAAAALFAALIAAMAWLVLGMMTSSGAYRQALARAQANPGVRAALGTPIEAGRWVTGDIRTRNDEGEARLAIPLHGPGGKGTLYVEARRTEARWTLQKLDFTSTRDTRVDLLKSPADADRERDF